MTFNEVNRAEPFGIICRSCPVCIKLKLDFASLGSALLKLSASLDPLIYTGEPKITIRFTLPCRKYCCSKSEHFQEGTGKKMCRKETGGRLNLLTFFSPQSKPCHPQIKYLTKSPFQVLQPNKLQKHSKLTLSTVLGILGFVS